ncbi:SMP-30/gluconolactonase/LRE family protein [Streptomyces goshikiensis]|uniref:SMP-30/gluconolactonase/LRE family protein n=1 Tax=Streptomyces goshikiensis TaxID=1942 RepID=UPI0036C9B92C
MVRLPRVAGAGAVAVALAVLASAPAADATALAEPPPPPPQPPSTLPAPAPAAPLSLVDPHIVRHFDLAGGQTPENIALEPDGSADLTFSFARQVAHLDKRGHVRTIATLPAVADPQTPEIGAAVTTGLARAHDRTLYVGYATGTDAAGVWRITPNGEVSRFTDEDLPARSFINGLALDERHGVLYAADSYPGKVWRISLDDGSATAWASGPGLERVGFFGANGIKVREGSVWVSNFDRGTLLRIPIEADGSAGPVETRATGLDGIDDFAFAGKGETVLAALNSTSEVAVVRRDGSHTVLLTAADGLSNPTSVAVNQQKVYVPSAAYNTQNDPNLLLARLEKHRPKP